jgi:DNA-binding CsgD family transcriptional regulator
MIKNKPVKLRVFNHPKGSAMFSKACWERIAGALELTRRELDVARSIFDDLTELATAARLGLSRHTVHSHCGRLFRKVGATSRVTLILLVFEKNLELTCSPTGHRRNEAEPPGPGAFQATNRSEL